jgi:hypothetical protein
MWTYDNRNTNTVIVCYYFNTKIILKNRKQFWGAQKLKENKIVQGRSFGIERNVETKTILKKRKLFL